MEFDEYDMAETIKNRQKREDMQEKLASSQDQVLRALKDMVIRCAPDGTQDDGDFVGFYVLPTGPVHRAIATLQNVGISADTMGDVSVISRYQAHLRQLIEAESTRREEALLDELLGYAMRKANHFTNVTALSADDIKEWYQERELKR